MFAKEKTNWKMMDILLRFKLFRHGGYHIHIFQVQTLTELILRLLMEKTDRYVFTEEDIKDISEAAALHDIGKTVIPPEILNKPGCLTKDEFEIMKTHTIEGVRILNRHLKGEDKPVIRYAYEICRWHHERYDGSGYPDGLKGEEIPITAQVVALADAYDALVSKRAYKDAYTPQKAVQMLMNGECGVFNPFLLECVSEIPGLLRQQEKERLLPHG